MSHLKVTQAGLVSALTFIVGQAVAFVPAFGPDKQALISAGTAVISAVFLVANAIHHLADSNVSARDVEAGAIAAARSEIGKVDFNSLVSDAVNAKSLPDLERLVGAEVQRIVSGAFGAQPVAGASSIAVPSAGVGPTGA